MMLELKDVIHHHLGCVIQTPEGMGRFLAIYAECPEPVVCADTVKSDWEVDDVKPVLWKLYDMPHVHVLALAMMVDPHCVSVKRSLLVQHQYLVFSDDKTYVAMNLEKLLSSQMAFVLKLHYDVFGLIERGLAVDVATLEANPYDVPYKPLRVSEFNFPWHNSDGGRVNNVRNVEIPKDYDRERGEPVPLHSLSLLQHGDYCIVPRHFAISIKGFSTYFGVTGIVIQDILNQPNKVCLSFGEPVNKIAVSVFLDGLNASLRQG
jgi:hypothetical protein